MVLVGLIEEGLAFLNGLLMHFINVNPVQPGAGGIAFATDGNNEWVMFGGAQNYSMTAKGNALVGAIADIAVYGAVLGDWIVQALVGTSLGNFA